MSADNSAMRSIVGGHRPPLECACPFTPQGDHLMLKITGFPTRLTLNCGLLLLASSAVYAQTITATLEGHATDSSGAAVPEAVVTVVNMATGASRSGNSSDQGEYRFALLPAGEVHGDGRKERIQPAAQKGNAA